MTCALSTNIEGQTFSSPDPLSHHPKNKEEEEEEEEEEEDAQTLLDNQLPIAWNENVQHGLKWKVN